MDDKQEDKWGNKICSPCAEDTKLRVVAPCPVHQSLGAHIYRDLGVGEFLYGETLSGENIRVITIQTGTGKDVIRCSLEVLPLYQIVQYTALSYVWGDATIKKSIVCNGVQMYVTENLYEALWRLREDGQTQRPLWVDAVCINQANIAEKTEQVCLMRNIYEQATLVFSWLGNPTDPKKNQKAMSKIRNIYRDLGSPSTIHEILQYTQADSRRLSTAIVKSSYRSGYWEGLIDVISRPYFSRAWIIQEILLGKQCIVQFGTQSVSREAILAVAAVFEHSPYLQYRSSKTLPLGVGLDEEAEWRQFTNELTEFFQGKAINKVNDRSPTPSVGALWALSRRLHDSGGAGVPILELLYATRAFEASVPHDRVFALAALSADFPSELINYKKPIDQLQIELAQLCMRTAPAWGPMIFSYVDIKHHSQNLPSWVPDWSANTKSRAALGNGYNDSIALDGLSVNWQYTSDNHILVPGRIVDDVNTIVSEQPYMTSGSNLGSSSSSVLYNLELKEWNDTCRALVQAVDNHATSDDLDEIFPNILVFGRDSSQKVGSETMSQSYERWISYLSDFREAVESMKTTYEKFSKERAVLQSAPTTIPGKLHRWAVGLKVGLSIVPVHDKLTMKTQSLRLKAIKAAKFESALKRFSYDRKFFRSGLGSAGWVPSSAHVGDSVCVFEDCKVPFILRKCDGGYRLIGDCYAHGLMDRLNTDWDLDKVEMIHLV